MCSENKNLDISEWKRENRLSNLRRNLSWWLWQQWQQKKIREKIRLRTIYYKTIFTTSLNILHIYQLIFLFLFVIYLYLKKNLVLANKYAERNSSFENKQADNNINIIVTQLCNNKNDVFFCIYTIEEIKFGEKILKTYQRLCGEIFLEYVIIFRSILSFYFVFSFHIYFILIIFVSFFY